MKRIFPPESESADEKKVRRDEPGVEKQENISISETTDESNPTNTSENTNVESDASKDKENSVNNEDTSTDKGKEKGGGDAQMQTETETNSEPKQDEKKDEGRWQLTPQNVKQRMNYLLTSCSLSDCTFVIGKEEKQEFKLHAVILSMSSPEFEDMLNESNIINIPDIEPEIFKQVVEYVYLDYINLWSVEKTQALYRASSKFKLPHLSSKAVEFLMEKMNLDSIWPIFDAAIATQDVFLIDECSKFFKKNIRDLLKHEKFRNVDSSIISNLIQDNSLNVIETDLINGVIQWANQRCADMEVSPTLENKRSVLGSQVVSNLRFLSVNKEIFVNQFAYNHQKSDENILTMEESYALLMNMVVPKSHPLPEGFSAFTTPRSSAERLRLKRRIFNPLGTYSGPQGRCESLVVYANSSMTAPIGTKNFSLELTINRSIVLNGIQLPTFSNALIGSGNYDEIYVVTVQNLSLPNKPVMSSITWTGRVSYNSVVDILFKDHIKLEKNVRYAILVYTSNLYYVNQKLCTVEESGSIKFIFKDSVVVFGKNNTPDFGFVSQIIYTPFK